MSGLAAVVHLGTEQPLGGVAPTAVAHLYGGGLPRFVAYEVRGDGPDLERVPGAYAPALDADPAYPITDLLLALARRESAIGQRIEVLSEKARVNYGRDFREMVFDSDVERGSPGWGRLFEARSQLESHPYEGVVALGLYPGTDDRLVAPLRSNLDRLDAPVRWLDGPGGSPD